MEINRDMLVKIKKTTPQADIKDAKERYVNNEGAFEVVYKGLSKDFTILLVDDVYTTGSTIRECAKVLKKAGYKRFLLL